MKTEQFNNHIKNINKRSMVASIVIVLVAFALRFTASPEEVEQYMFQFAYTVLFLLVLVHLKANNLKQKAIIRYITDSISDNE
ncbi:hypothetical protein [Marinicella rhabdoformis]|uniref:hypothetical protein n=1 Tax=Marinicella rhabdoformis TaxID=2580566 RepID=UPI0012AED842|nr:hypothetical protein [Marinicella rhabdoformis]